MTVTINGSAGVTTNSGAVYDSLQRGTAATASGTSVDFTSIPSWVRRITVIFNGISTSGTSQKLVRIGSGSIATTNYVSNSALTQGNAVSTSVAITSGFLIASSVAVDALYGMLTLVNVSGNIWVSNHTIFSDSTNDYVIYGGGSSLTAISSTLDQVRITTVNGTDTFDAGTINIIYE
jgi:hypothetical protein